jgi:hypothetical protein
MISDIDTVNKFYQGSKTTYIITTLIIKLNKLCF